jgi:hypothetical protein
MIQFGLNKHPDAVKWKEVKDEVVAAEPAINEVDDRRIGPAWKRALRKFSTSMGKHPAEGSVDQARVSKTPVEESRDMVDESKILAKRRREAAKVVGAYMKELLNGANSYSQITHAIAKYAGKGAIDVFNAATATILEMQRASMPASLIKTSLKSSYGEEFDELVAAIGALATSKNGKIRMQNGWKRMPLPVSLNTNSGNHAEKHEQNGLKQPPFAVANAPTSSPIAASAASEKPNLAGQQGLPTPEQVSEWAEVMESLLKSMAEMAGRALNDSLWPKYIFTRGIPDDPNKLADYVKRVDTINRLIATMKKGGLTPDPIALATHLGFYDITGRIFSTSPTGEFQNQGGNQNQSKVNSGRPLDIDSLMPWIVNMQIARGIIREFQSMMNN